MIVFGICLLIGFATPRPWQRCPAVVLRAFGG
jgi:hypothetical protein